MYEFFKDIAEKNTCNLNGACSIHPSLYDLYEILLDVLRENSFYLVKLKSFNITNQEYVNKTLEVLSIFLINTNFNKENYLNLLKQMHFIKKDIKSIYIDFCEKNQFPCESIHTFFEFDENLSIEQLIKKWEEIIKNRNKNLDKEKKRLYELINIISRITARNIIKIKEYQKDFLEFDFEVIRFFALTNSFSIRNDKIIRRILQFCDISRIIFQKLNTIYEDKYGKKECAYVNLAPQKGHSILVSGDDLNSLEEVLKELEKMRIKEKINVYTHGPLFQAHFYPYFKNNKFLAGHIGTGNAEHDFSLFSGSILITKNFVQKIDNLYKGEIFSQKTISFEKMQKIENKDYSKLINTSLKLQGYLKNAPKNILKITKKTFDFAQITSKIDEIVIIFGQYQIGDFVSEYKNKKIVNIESYCDIDILFDFLNYLQTKNIKTTLFFSYCNILSLNILISILNLDLDIYIPKCSNMIINPHIVETLNLEFGVKII